MPPASTVAAGAIAQGAGQVFAAGGKPTAEDAAKEALVEKLYAKVGQLTVERDSTIPPKAICCVATYKCQGSLACGAALSLRAPHPRYLVR